MSKKQHASFWKYTGNHHAGKNCPRKDLYGFGIELISYVAYCVDNGEFRNISLNSADIVVKHFKGDSFGHEVEVATTKEIWELANQDYEEYKKLYA